MAKESLLDTVAHPFDSMAVINWMLDQWDGKFESPILILTRKGDGDALANRIRAQLSITRKSIREQHGQLRYEFGFNHHVFFWTLIDGRTIDAVAFQPFQSRRHRFKQIFSESKLGESHG